MLHRKKKMSEQERIEKEVRKLKKRLGYLEEVLELWSHNDPPFLNFMAEIEELEKTDPELAEERETDFLIETGSRVDDLLYKEEILDRAS